MIIFLKKLLFLFFFFYFLLAYLFLVHFDASSWPWLKKKAKHNFLAFLFLFTSHFLHHKTHKNLCLQRKKKQRKVLRMMGKFCRFMIGSWIFFSSQLRSVYCLANFYDTFYCYRHFEKPAKTSNKHIYNRKKLSWRERKSKRENLLFILIILLSFSSREQFVVAYLHCL